MCLVLEKPASCALKVLISFPGRESYYFPILTGQIILFPRNHCFVCFLMHLVTFAAFFLRISSASIISNLAFHL